MNFVKEIYKLRVKLDSKQISFNTFLDKRRVLINELHPTIKEVTDHDSRSIH